MSQRDGQGSGNDHVRIFDATAQNETYQLAANFSPGRREIMRREDSGVSHTVTITVATGQSIDGVTNATVTIAGNSEAIFTPTNPGVWESYGLASAEAAGLAADPAFTGTFAAIATLPVTVGGLTQADIDAAFATAGSARAVYFPPGTYLTTKALPFTTSFTGAGAGKTILQATGTWTDTMMVDFNVGGYDKYIAGVTFDAAIKTGLKIFGSSGDAQGSSKGLFSNIQFLNTAPGVYAVGGASSTSVPGMLTGSVFLRCSWDNCAQWLQIGNNQDDVLVIGLRGAMDVTNQPTSHVIKCQGNGAVFDTPYIFLQTANYGSFGVIPFMEIGSGNCEFRNAFFESSVGTNITHIAHLANPSASFRLSGIRLNFDGSTLVALIRSQVNSGTNANSMHAAVERLVIDPGSPSTVALLELFVSASITGKAFDFTFSGCDKATSIFQYGSGSTSTFDQSLYLDGVYRGVRQSSSYSVSGGTGVATSIINPNPSVDVQVFTASGTWTKPTWATTVQVTAVAGGGGGGGGRQGTAGSIRCGGGAGGAASRLLATFPAAALGSAETITVGAGGTAGAGAATTSTDGGAGGAGGQTAFGAHVKALPGSGGGGGTASTGTAGAGGGGMFSGGAGGAAAVNGAAGSAGATAAGGASGGGAAGGITSGDTATAGGNGGVAQTLTTSAAAGGAAGVAGAAGSSAATSSGLPGSGGGGGGASATAPGAGGVGGNYGGGAGGGGASLNGVTAGSGGVGGSGIVVVVSYG